MNYNDGYDFKDGYITLHENLNLGHRHVFKLEPSTRIEIMNKGALERFNKYINYLNNMFDVCIEKPLDEAKLRGVYRIVFLDKHKINYVNFSIVAMY